MTLCKYTVPGLYSIAAGDENSYSIWTLSLIADTLTALFTLISLT